MVLELARDSVKTKRRFAGGTIVGNYEFYYACGMICRNAKVDIMNTEDPKALKQMIIDLNYTTEDKGLSAVYNMLKHYDVEDKYDSQMGELFQMGLSDS